MVFHLGPPHFASPSGCLIVDLTPIDPFLFCGIDPQSQNTCTPDHIHLTNKPNMTKKYETHWPVSYVPQILGLLILPLGWLL